MESKVLVCVFWQKLVQFHCAAMRFSSPSSRHLTLAVPSPKSSNSVITQVARLGDKAGRGKRDREYGNDDILLSCAPSKASSFKLDVQLTKSMLNCTRQLLQKDGPSSNSDLCWRSSSLRCHRAWLGWWSPHRVDRMEEVIPHLQILVQNFFQELRTTQQVDLHRMFFRSLRRRTYRAPGQQVVNKHEFLLF